MMRDTFSVFFLETSNAGRKYEKQFDFQIGDELLAYKLRLKMALNCLSSYFVRVVHRTFNLAKLLILVTHSFSFDCSPWLFLHIFAIGTWT